MSDLRDQYANAVQLYQSFSERMENEPELDLNDALLHADNLVLALSSAWVKVDAK